MSEIEDRSHFALWCILASPLIAGNDLRSMSATTQGILTCCSQVMICAA